MRLQFWGLTILALIMPLAAPPRSARADSVVGTGKASSCTEAALTTALHFGGHVTFNCGASPAAISLTGQKILGGSLSIDGGGLVTLRSGRLVVDSAASITLSNLTIRDAAAASGFGGAVVNNGTLNVANCTFVRNSVGGNFGAGVFYCGNGGAIYNGGWLTVTNSTFIDNSAYCGGGGAISNGASTATVSNSTFSGNSDSAIVNDLGTLTVSNCTFASNDGALENIGYTNAPATVTVTNSTFSDSAVKNNGGAVILKNTIAVNGFSPFVASCVGPVTDGGHNIDSATSCGFSSGAGSLSNVPSSLVLAPEGLANNGGPTETIALQAFSAAISRGDEAICSAQPVSNLDQRGHVRPGSGTASCSIGAYEYNSPGTPRCCQCPASCAAPVNGSCGGCAPVFGASCVGGDLCVVDTPTSTPTMTSTPTRTPPPTDTYTPTTSPTNTYTPTQTATATKTAGSTDCCQCSGFCSGPIGGTCGGCAVVYAASCTEGAQCMPSSPTPTAITTFIPTMTHTPTPSNTVRALPTSVPTQTVTTSPTQTPPPTHTATFTPANTPTTTPTPLATPSNTSSPTITTTARAASTATPTNTVTRSPIVTPTGTPVATTTHTPTRTASPTFAPKLCAGDCSGDGQVTINEILTMVNIALGDVSETACNAGDTTGDRATTIDEILAAVNNALNGCGGTAWNIGGARR